MVVEVASRVVVVVRMTSVVVELGSLDVMVVGVDVVVGTGVALICEETMEELSNSFRRG